MHSIDPPTKTSFVPPRHIPCAPTVVLTFGEGVASNADHSNTTTRRRSDTRHSVPALCRVRHNDVGCCNSAAQGVATWGAGTANRWGRERHGSQIRDDVRHDDTEARGLKTRQRESSFSLFYGNSDSGPCVFVEGWFYLCSSFFLIGVVGFILCM